MAYRRYPRRMAELAHFVYRNLPGEKVWRELKGGDVTVESYATEAHHVEIARGLFQMSHAPAYVPDAVRRAAEPVGFRVSKLLEAAEEMELTPEDLQRLYQKFPDRYRELLIAKGIELAPPAG